MDGSGSELTHGFPPDHNLHFNGDYRKKLNCSHYYLGIFMYD